jgi:hypothetical protein
MSYINKQREYIPTIKNHYSQKNQGPLYLVQKNKGIASFAGFEKKMERK